VGDPPHSAKTPRRPARSAAPRRSAESAAATTATNGRSRARSTTVRAAEVTGTPRTHATWCGGRAATRNRAPTTRRRPICRRTVNAAVVGQGASVANSCSQAADSWLPTAGPARAPSSAASASACATRGVLSGGPGQLAPERRSHGASAPSDQRAAPRRIPASSCPCRRASAREKTPPGRGRSGDTSPESPTRPTREQPSTTGWPRSSAIHKHGRARRATSVPRCVGFAFRRPGHARPSDILYKHVHWRTLGLWCR
jgi:hypothetical protein